MLTIAPVIHKGHNLDLIVTFSMNDMSFIIVTFFYERHYLDLIVTFL